MYTRQQYLDRECTHREYYGQFVCEETKIMVLRYLKINKVELAELLNKDEHLNNIPLRKWDEIPLVMSISMKDVGDYMTAAGKVCILKEAARQIIES